MKKLALSILTLSLATSAFSITGHGYRIISETNTTTGDARGWVIHDVDKPNLKYIAGAAETFDAKGHIKDYIKLESDHYYNIKNNSNYKLNYAVVYKINCLNGENKHRIELELDPQGSVEETAENDLLIQPMKDGHFRIYAETIIQAGEGESRNDDTKYLTVIKSDAG